MLSLLALSLGATAALAQGTKGGDGHVGGSFEDGGDTLVSGMMLFLGNENKVYILDKSENNAAQINGHPAMGSVWDMNTRKSEVLEVRSNPFCASGMHMPNGSFITFGGNGAIGPGGNVGDTNNGAFDTVFGDLAGQTGVRVMNPLDCTGDDAATKAECQWYDDPSVTHLKAMRWYSTAEPQADGSVVIIGGYSNGGYINRNYPDGNDPVWQGGASQPTYEFWPPTDATPPVMPILVEAGGLNSYPHTHLMRSGKMLMQVNVSTILFDPATGDEKRLPPMPENIVRVYPASGAVTMLPMTPANNYSQTVLYCGGSDLPDDAWGNYSWPFVNTWEYPASKKCHSLEAEPLDGSEPAYVEEDPMPEGRTMGQFINLPDGTILMVNGGLNGTAGYSEMTLQTTSYSQMPYGMSLASGPVGRPAIYDPRKPKGQRWITEGLATSDVARLYHSSAILLPDASVMIAGGNPNVDVNLTTVFPTTYKAEIFYPPYFSAPQRPKPEGVPKTISYGGDAFDIKIPASGYSGSANDAADNATVVLIRPGFTTHAMNMGQRHLQLENTYTVQDDGTLVLHVAQAPPVPELFQPGPALLFVTVNGIPSNGTLVTVGNGQIGKQPIGAIAQLPASQRSTSAPQGSGSSGSGSNGSGSGDKSNAASHTGPIIGGIIAAIALVGILGAVFGICITRRRRAASQLTAGPSYPMGTASGAGGVGGILPGRGVRNSDSSAFVPLQQDNSSGAWNANASQLSLNSPFSPYHDEHYGGDGEFDPYRQNSPRMPPATPGRY